MKAKKEAEMRAREKMEKEKEIRERADEIAGQVNEFFTFLIPQVEETIAEPSAAEQGEDLDPRPESDSISTQVPSLDAITVTTAFGVHEEPNNVTTITAAGPAYTTTTSTGEVSQPEYEPTLLELMYEADIADEEDAADVEGGSSHDDGDDADVDTDDFDAESALIDEFIDDGTLTPTTTTSHVLN